MILLAVGLFKPSSIQPPGLGMSESELGTAPRKQVGNWYFRTEQWRADARTLVAAARWCLEVNPTTNPGTNLSAGAGLPNTNTAVISRT